MSAEPARRALRLWAKPHGPSRRCRKLETPISYERLMSLPTRADPFVGLNVASETHPGVSYKIERQLGEGGTAVAYFASRIGPEGQSPVVLKIILPNIIMHAGETARMVVQKESVALGRLNERVPPCPFV